MVWTGPCGGHMSMAEGWYSPGTPDDDDECLLALTFVTITHNGVATNREMTYVNI